MPFLAYVLVLLEDVLTEQPVEDITAYIGENKVLLGKASPCGVCVCSINMIVYRCVTENVCGDKRIMSDAPLSLFPLFLCSEFSL